MKISNSPLLKLKKKGTTFTSKSSLSEWPRRIICLTAETTEIAFALGAGDRVVGISGYSVRPPEARKKPKVAAFTSIRLDKIRELKPDLILGFSDLQKDILRDLVAEGFNVFVTNQRSLEETGQAILATGRILGEEKKAMDLCGRFFAELDTLAEETAALGFHPSVYFEEWDDPMITGIRWVSEIIEKLGGRDVFKDKSGGNIAPQRKVTSEEVIRRNPEIILASWCGKKVKIDKIRSRPGWETIDAVKNDRIYEIKSIDILAPGPSLIHGARQIAEILKSAPAPCARMS